MSIGKQDSCLCTLIAITSLRTMTDDSPETCLAFHDEEKNPTKIEYTTFRFRVFTKQDDYIKIT